MVDINIFEKFVKEYFELKGYFLHENIHYGHNNEVDLLGIHPKNNEVIHIEITEQNYSANDLEDAIKRKFDNPFIKDLYNEKFYTTDIPKKIFVIWGYKNKRKWIQQQKVGEKHNIEILSYEDIFKFFEENSKNSTSLAKCKNKIHSLINMFDYYKKNTN